MKKKNDKEFSWKNIWKDMKWYFNVMCKYEGVIVLAFGLFALIVYLLKPYI